MKLLEAISRWNTEVNGGFNPDFEIGVLSNTTVNNLKYFLELELYDKKIKSLVTLGNYDNIVSDSVEFSNKNSVIIFFDLVNLSDYFIYEINTLDADEINNIYDSLCKQIALILKNLKKVPLVFFNKFCSSGIEIRHNNKNHISELCERLNGFLESNKQRNCILVDPNLLHIELGLINSVDMRSFRNNKTWYTYSFMREYSRLISPFIASASGKTKKVLVVDCDNTLWGGVIGEDGMQGIHLGGHTKIGRVFTEVQMIIKGLQKNGVLLAINSKNNIEDVVSVLRTHPSMVLKEDDFIIIKANWKNKAINLREIASELNLGIDSIVFLDDSEFELGLVSNELPEIEVIRVPEILESYPSVAKNIYSHFYNPSLSKEDLKRNQMYRQEVKRRSSAEEFSDVEDYLESLGLIINIKWGVGIDISRASQMTQKTNQFNLTTVRYTEAEIEVFSKSSENLICTISVADKHGDSGITGLCILKKISSESWGVDTFLMSCRIIGRGIEYKFLDLIVQKLKDLNVNKLTGQYVRTAKNDQVSNLWSSAGFKLTYDDGSKKLFEINLADYQKSGKDYIGVI